MIRVQQPSMVLNAYDRGADAASGYNSPVLMQMQNTWYVPQTVLPYEMAANIEHVIQSAAIGGRLKTLIFCCHGAPGCLGIGSGIRAWDLPAFSRPGLRGRINEVWLRACLVARIQTPDGNGTRVPAVRPYVTGTINGGAFCQELADTLQCTVVASTELQVASSEACGTRTRYGIPELPYGMMDEWDGLVGTFRPGVASRFQRFPSVWLGSPTDIHDGHVFPGR